MGSVEPMETASSKYTESNPIIHRTKQYCASELLTIQYYSVLYYDLLQYHSQTWKMSPSTPSGMV